ncbi:hypothetical protein [Halobacterium jilantaiense]|uniref:Restriction endonuclease n=1 Tax=Halobacterium jilantaiense TaxID=355548 RepID=A0A1I0MGD3_9EURY|nr:hypothetical protein [Halobacterium jilantaiense]SEV87362.1 hypothetical protein SAMN04487945_0042 [Halobacterium jilantaiense]
MAASPFLDDVRQRLVAEGWVTASARVNSETVVMRALREDGKGPSKLLAMVVDDADAAATADHVQYLIRGAAEASADATLLTSLATVTDRAHRTADDAGVAVVAPSTLRDDTLDTTVLDVLANVLDA